MNNLPPKKNPLPPLDKSDYPNVKFWMKKVYNKRRGEKIGDTNALATTKRKRGRPKQNDVDNSDGEENEDKRHTYLEDVNGNPVTTERLWQISVKARQCWFLLHKAQLAPLTWTKIEIEASEFFRSEMLSEFSEFRLCNGCWKLELWATLNYPSWFKNHVKIKDVLSSRKTAKKVKVRMESPIDLDDAHLIRMDEKPLDEKPLDNTTANDSDRIGTPSAPAPPPPAPAPPPCFIDPL